MVCTPISASETIFYDWHERFLDSWLNIPKGLKVARAKFPEPCIDIVRDKMVQIAIQTGAHWLFMVDADVECPPDVLSSLLRWNLPIVGGLYVRRHNPPFNEMLKFRTDGISGLRPIMDGEYQDGSLVECDALGTGCVLFNMEVFDKVKPYQVSIDGKPARPQFFLWTEWRIQPGFSEDFSAFVRFRECGIPVYCDTSVKCKHVGPVKFVPGGGNNLNIEFIGGP